MVRIEWLDRHMDKCNEMAQWIHQEFSYEYAHQPLASWQQEFSAGQQDGRWKCLVAMRGDQLLGAPHWPAMTWPHGPIWGRGWRACSSRQRPEEPGSQHS